MPQIALLCLLLGLLPPAGAADEGLTPLTPEELIAKEEARAAVESALALFASPAVGWDKIENAVRAAENLLPHGVDVVPFIESELYQRMGDYDFCAYVLGRLRNDEAEAALERALARAEDEPGQRGRMHESWIAWALALHGRVDILDHLHEGRHDSATFPMHKDTSVIELVGLLTAPQSVPRLIAMVERLADDPGQVNLLLVVIRGLGRIGDTSAIPTILPLLRHDDRSTRTAAAAALQSLRSPEAVTALVLALDDPDPMVRRSTAMSLDRLGVTDRSSELAAKLAGEDDVFTRGVLYRILAASGDDEAWRALDGAWNRPEALDRRRLVEAYALTGSRFASRIDAALLDIDGVVAASALSAAREIHGNAGAIARLVEVAERVPYTSWPSLVGQHLLELRPAALGEPATRVLTGGLLTGARNDRRRLAAARSLAELLVAIGHEPAIESLRAALQQPGAPLADRRLSSSLLRLEAIRSNGNDVDAWRALLTPDHTLEMRQLAVSRLSRLRRTAADRALVETFDSLDLDSREGALLGEAIVLSAIDRPSPRLVALCARVLLEPSFDLQSRRMLRESAAWVARRTENPRLVRALLETIERRKGRDYVPLVYAALLEGRRGAELLERHRLPRLEYMNWLTGVEQQRLDQLGRILAAGRRVPLFRYDVVPTTLRP